MAGLPRAEATPLFAADLSEAEPDLFLSRLFFVTDAGTILSGDPSNNEWLHAQYGEGVRIVACSPRAVLAAIEQRFRALFRERAVCELASREPQFSASVVITSGQIIAFAVIASLTVWAFVAMPKSAGTALAAMCVALFLANSVFRALLLWVGADFWRAETSAPPSPRNAALPTYSILVPLYREANMMPALMRALCAIDYPGIR